MNALTVADVSGVIAAAFAVAQFVVPLVLPLILLGLFKEKNSATTAPAVTWSVVGSFINNSLWPSILHSDSATTNGVPTQVVTITRIKIFLMVLVPLAATITPIGLYQTILASKSPTLSAFHYIVDNSVFGHGTPRRVNLPWSRLCGYVQPYPCPDSFSNFTFFSNASGSFVDFWNYDSSIPQYVIDVFESGLPSLPPSVSSIFDIQSRSYSWSKLNPFYPFEPVNITAYPVSTFRQIASLIMQNGSTVVEGLVVDMANGGIGFRNHSAPPFSPFGSLWSEDLLFIEPESQCVDTNLTLDFMIPIFTTTSASSTSGPLISNLVLTDRGGFANLSLTSPDWSSSNSQKNPQLYQRAYTAAWINNANSMVFMNITNFRNTSDPKSRALEYIHSTLGKTYPLMNSEGYGTSLTLQPDALYSSPNFGGYLSGLNEGMAALYSNPFNVTRDDFADAGQLCTGSRDGALANISNFAALCGLVYGAPRRQDSGSSIVFEPGSNWTIPLYSCISTVKAIIKTVSFRFNETDDLSGLTVVNITDKVYPDKDSLPVWGVEQTSLSLINGTALWGLVSGSDQGNVSITSLQKEYLYLPGYVNRDQNSPNFLTKENLPGTDFYITALGNAYLIGSEPPGITDYSGQSSLALFNFWQQLSRSPSTAAQILNLVWTDIAASSVVGTKGLSSTQTSLQKRYSSSESLTPVIFYEHRVRYHYVYGIPAFLVVLCLAALLLILSVLALLKRSGLTKMRRFLNKTSQGRILTSRVNNNMIEMDLASVDIASSQSTKRWVHMIGKKPITITEHEDPLTFRDDGQLARSQSDDFPPVIASL